MNKKGFTLVELLAVIIILSLLVILVLPSITNSVRNYSNKTDELTFSIIKDATKLYLDDNSNLFPKKESNTYCVLLSDLVKEDYLKESIEYGGEDITDTKSIKVTYNGGYEFELIDSSSCQTYKEVCVPVDDNTKTTGNIPSGNYEIGDEYICEVKENVKYHFFVVSTSNRYGEIITEDTIDKETVNVNLIMERNVCEDGTVATDENNCFVVWNSTSDTLSGPVTAMNYIYNSTSTWYNTSSIMINYTDEGPTGSYGYGGIETIGNTINIIKQDGTITGTYKNLKTRLPVYQEIYGIDRCSIYSGDDSAYGSCPLWLSNYLNVSAYVTGQGLNNINGIYGYWTLSSLKNASKVVTVHFYGVVNLDLVTFQKFGVRPVISVPKNYIKVN